LIRTIDFALLVFFTGDNGAVLLIVALNKRQGCNIARDDSRGEAGGGSVDSRKVASKKIEEA
jgi:hypothetical protein